MIRYFELQIPLQKSQQQTRPDNLPTIVFDLGESVCDNGFAISTDYNSILLDKEK